jgi:dTMP kinase
MARGLFITLEGGEGAGKSTQARGLADRLRGEGREVVVTREPGGSPGAEAIRALLVTGDVTRWSPTTEALLMYAARRDHIERVIAPALARGAVVVCDRFFDSTRAYQGAAGQASATLIGHLEAEVVLEQARPDLTLMLDLSPEEGLARAEHRAESKSRFEARNISFHRALRAAFLKIAEHEPDRCVVVDAARPPDAVAADVWRAVKSRL